MKQTVIVCPVVSELIGELTQEELLRLRTERLLKELNQTSLEAEKKIVEIVDMISKNRR